ncbi:unnamed protein product [Linum trigynum]|uniref:Uncharacterized protein n=1 Tax=Linum trigynum TaxID=586398 RepID=A0AAV2DMP5_9ROSI
MNESAANRTSLLPMSGLKKAPFASFFHVPTENPKSRYVMAHHQLIMKLLLIYIEETLAPRGFPSRNSLASSFRGF